MEVEGGVRAVLMDFGSARPARVAVRTRREALMQQADTLNPNSKPQTPNPEA